MDIKSVYQITMMKGLIVSLELSFMFYGDET